LRYFWNTIIPEELVDNWHIKFLCDQLQEIGECLKAREPWTFNTLIINIPPGTSKTTIVSIMFPAWLWCIDPTLKILSGTYSGDLSVQHAVRSRDIIQSEMYQELFPDVAMKKDENNKTGYTNTKNGARMATSVGGTATGTHAHLILIDDPLSAKQAQSEAERKSANDFLTQTLSTRKVNKDLTVTILVMQRLHEDDPTGMLLSNPQKQVKHICLPGELSEDIKPLEARQYYIDKLLDPVRLSANTLRNMQIDLGSYGYAGQIMQRPAPKEGELIKKQWFNRFTVDSLIRMIKEKKGEKVNASKYMVKKFYSDTAYGKEGSDNTATMTYTVFNGDLFVWDVWAENLSLPDFKRKFVNYLQLNGYTSKSISRFEPKASGISAVQEIKELEIMIDGEYERINVTEDEPPKESKISRVIATSPKIESGHVYLMEGASWIQDFIEECTAFPNGIHDDRVDTLTAVIKLHLQKEKQDDDINLSWA
jgi:predicted phage terminase large subunit-like protein